MDATAGRRWFGGIVLVAALLMLLLGQTVLRSELRDEVYLLYWLGCIALTALAMLIALWDFSVVRRRSRQAERALLHSTLQQIEDQARAKQRHQQPPAKNQRGQKDLP